MSKAKENFNLQKLLTAVGVFLFLVKLYAWYATNSVAILTDALESTVNIISAGIGLYSLYLSSRPRDENHPYGHGKVEFISAAIEGTLISVAGFVIIYEAINNLKHPHVIAHLDAGIILVSITALINFGMGYWAIKKGERNHSLALVASGKHLKSDTYSTLGIIIGLLLIAVTGMNWLDSLVAFVFAFLIIFTGFKIVRDSLAGIMDEADNRLLTKVVALLEDSRQANWIDLHNLRIIKYGGTLHLDCHLTVPWFLNVHEAHAEIDQLAQLVREHFGESVELFVHTDGCMDFSCRICTKSDCKVRQFEFVKKITWNVKNISENSKHRIDG